jgi:hypothetical protein
LAADPPEVTMSVFTVHEPPARASEAFASPERFAFVRDGFSFWAFLITPIWMLWHRLWLVLVIYLALSGLLHAGLWAAGAPGGVRVFVSLLLALLVGVEAGSLRRWTLGRRRWRELGVVVARDRDEAERRFFDAWDAPALTRSATPASSQVPPAGGPRLRNDIIGLFPEAGASR